MHYQMELAGETATLYVTGSLGDEHVETLIRSCAATPKRARTLRVDLHGLGNLSADAIGAVRRLLHFWRDSRRGDFRLTTSHMSATLHDARDERDTRETRTPAVEWRTPRCNEALAGIYL